MSPTRFVCALAALILAPLIADGSGVIPRAGRPAESGPPAPPPSMETADPTTLRLEAVEIEPGRTLNLHLERFDILDPDAVFIVAGADGEFETTPPAVALYRGTLPDDPDSLIVVASTPRGTSGIIRTPNQTRALTPTPTGFKTLPFDDTPITTQLCAVNARADNFTPGWPEPDHQANRTTAQGETEGAPCRVASIAIDTDWECTQKFGVGGEGDAQSAAEYAVFLLGAVSEIYRRDLNVRLNVTYLRIWADAADPWDNSDSLYNQFYAYWNTNMLAVPRDAALLLSARLDQVFAGEASIAALCITDDAYAVVTKLSASFPFPVQNQSPSNWDLFISAHELGHVFGSIHTHEYAPPIDSCGSGNCANANLGTIMSYCHLCAGGVNNINLQFHPRVIETILAYLDAAPCDLAIDGNHAADDHAHAAELLPTTIDVLLNDQMISCATVAIDAFDPISANGGTVELVPAGAFGRQRLRYTPPIGAGPTDTFTYSIVDGMPGGAATVTIDITPLRAPDLTGAIEPGVDARYFIVSGVTQIPDYTALSSYASGIVPMLNYPATNAPFATSGRTDFVGARFDAFINAPVSGLYTLYLASDDGSILSIGNATLIDNDGIHTMTERSAVIGLQQGMHRLRIDFFERNGPAGLIVSWAGPGITKQPIPALNWFQSVPCPGDRNLDATVNVDDLNIVLSQWGMAVPPFTGGDDNGDGQVTVNDLNIILSHWANTCP
ncbi:MAG: hypothetical protein KDA16_12765 [Phycisphaerales bacterium]|nr:hypothetical protein [Phycisphaerales bacterium]